MDDQLLELCGRHRLTESLLGAGLEVAFPARDRGIDLIAYALSGPHLPGFGPCSISLDRLSSSHTQIEPFLCHLLVSAPPIKH
jgi:hypothetical protein